MRNSLLLVEPSRFFSSCIKGLIPKGFSMALWRSPLATQKGIQGMFSSSSQLCEGDWNAFLAHPSAFIWAPSISILRNSYQYLVPEARLEEQNGAWAIHDPKGLLKDGLSSFDHSVEGAEIRSKDLASTAQATYTTAVKTALEAIEASSLQKVVLAQTQWRACVPMPALYKVFSALCVRYPMAFVYLFASPSVGIWIGASPERLLHYANHRLCLQSLAATRAVAPHAPWPKKEQLEQNLVSTHIQACLAALPSHKVSKTQARTVRHGALEHLQTDYELHLPHSTSASALGSFIQALHPTPALCGTPRQSAIQWIRQQENFSREYFTGFLGPVQPNHMDLYVNIRCGRCYANGIRLFAGAGIVKGADPKKEWAETMLKCEAIGYLFPKGNS